MACRGVDRFCRFCRSRGEFDTVTFRSFSIRATRKRNACYESEYWEREWVVYRETLWGDAVRVARYNPIQLERWEKAREGRKGETKLSADRIYSCNTRVTLYSLANFPNDLVVLLVFSLNTTKLWDKSKPVKPKRFLPSFVVARQSFNACEKTKGFKKENGIFASGNSLAERERWIRRERNRNGNKQRDRKFFRSSCLLGQTRIFWCMVSQEIYDSKKYWLRYRGTTNDYTM